MREALDLDRAALYLPDADGQPSCAAMSATPPREELSFDEEAWRLAIAGGAPIVLREAASWLVANPFTPPARDWVILPLVTGEREMVGVVIASAREPIADRPAQRHRPEPARPRSSRAGITTARLRRELQAAPRWSASGARSPPRSTTASRSTSRSRGASSRCPSPTRERLREAVDAAHRLVRARLQALSADTPAGLREALEAAATRSHARRCA